MSRIIAHLDMDAFFAAIEERDRPRLKGLPIVIGADPKGGHGRGVVSTANYKAREYGIRSAIPINRAWEFSEIARQAGKPPAVFLGGDYHHYIEVSEEIFAVIKKFLEEACPPKFSGENFERGGLDEIYLDISFTENFNDAGKLMKKIKSEIKEKIKLSSSVGIGPNKLIAKIASDYKKPDGLTIITPKDVQKFLDPLPIRKIPGLGPKTEIQLEKIGIKTIADLRKISEEKMSKDFGKWGSALFSHARGEDDSPVSNEREVKSIGEQETFEKDTRDSGFITERLESLSAYVFKRFKESGFKTFRSVTITVRFSNFETKNRSHTFSLPFEDSAKNGETNQGQAMLKFEALKLLLPFLDTRENPKRHLIRLIGIRIEKFS
ncbi:MAG: DNA polymerase IV [Candidatus Paceibacterota bacterium]|jgi:DNA polymerase IV (DinB-like DNA polymerase)